MTRTRGPTLCSALACARRPGPPRAGHVAAAHRAALGRAGSRWVALGRCGIDHTPPSLPACDLDDTPQSGAAAIGIADTGR